MRYRIRIQKASDRQNFAGYKVNEALLTYIHITNTWEVEGREFPMDTHFLALDIMDYLGIVYPRKVIAEVVAKDTVRLRW